MIDIAEFIALADTYKRLTGVERDTTVSYRVFGDTKKLGQLRAGACDLTVGRYNAALVWFGANWPEGADRPALLPLETKEDAA